MGEVMTHHPIVHPILQPMFETLHTERLVLRPYHLDDAEARWQAIEESRDHLRRYEPEQAASCRSVAESQVWIIRANADWLVRKRFAIGIWTQVTNQYLGGIGLRPREGDDWSVPAFELGYWVRASAQGHGYVTEAVGSVTAALSHCFTCSPCAYPISAVASNVSTSRTSFARMAIGAS